MNSKPNDCSKPKHPERAVVEIVVWALIALLLNLILNEATFGFFAMGVIWSFFLTFLTAFVAIPVTAVIILVVAGLNRIGWLPGWVNVRTGSMLGRCLVLFGVASGLFYSRPSVRFEHLIGTDDHTVSEIEMRGFNAFLARRWLVSFEASESQMKSIASGLGLHDESDIDLRETQERDRFLSGLGSNLFEGVPSSGFSHAYEQSDPNNEGKHWAYLVYSDTLQKAWIYWGYQN